MVAVIYSSLEIAREFADEVEKGIRTRAISPRRKRGHDPRVGDTLKLFVKDSTRPVGIILRTAKVTRVREIRFATFGMTLDRQSLHAGFCADYQGPADPELYDGDFAVAYGFQDFEGLAGWIGAEYGLPFEGLLIEWAA
jgi:hypothetical protein